MHRPSKKKKKLGIAAKNNFEEKGTLRAENKKGKNITKKGGKGVLLGRTYMQKVSRGQGF